MRFPIRQTIAVARYIAENRREKRDKFPLVLMLEPLHACNLKCEGCGRIREYSETLSRQVPLADCVKAIDSCSAPVVSICGGEPLLYHDVKALVEESISRGKVTYLCTNGTILDWKLSNFTPHKMFNINIHIDGMEKTHDAITKRPGTFRQVTENIRIAKKMGFTVCTNTTVYHETEPEEIEDLFAHLSRLKVDGMLISPAFEYTDIVRRPTTDDCQPPLLKGGMGGLFMTRKEINEKFGIIRKFAKKYRVWSTPLYLDFLAGLRDYKCTPWGNVTFNIEGWKAPCYLITDRHYKDFDEFMKAVDWDRYVSEVDGRCKNCMVHSGFEASVALSTADNWKDIMRMSWWTVN